MQMYTRGVGPGQMTSSASRASGTVGHVTTYSAERLPRPVEPSAGTAAASATLAKTDGDAGVGGRWRNSTDDDAGNRASCGRGCGSTACSVFHTEPPSEPRGEEDGERIFKSGKDELVYGEEGDQGLGARRWTL